MFFSGAVFCLFISLRIYPFDTAKAAERVSADGKDIDNRRGRNTAIDVRKQFATGGFIGWCCITHGGGGFKNYFNAGVCQTLLGHLQTIPIANDVGIKMVGDA